MSKAFFKTPKFTAVYAHIAKPMTDENGQPTAYSIQILIDKEDPIIAEIHRLSAEVFQEKFGSKTKLINTGINDGDEKEYKESTEHLRKYYEGKYYINAKQKISEMFSKRPRLLLPTKEDLREADAAQVEKYFYSGAILKALVTLYAYEHKGKRGIGFGLHSLIFKEHGERIQSNSINAEEAFKDDFEEEPSSTPWED